MWSRRLRCPHCHMEFDYDFVPGMSVTALRLGTSRYMRCPRCHRWGMFPLTRPTGQGNDAASGPPPVPPVEGQAGGTGEAPRVREAVPRFNALGRWPGGLRCWSYPLWS